MQDRIFAQLDALVIGGLVLLIVGQSIRCARYWVLQRARALSIRAVAEEVLR